MASNKVSVASGFKEDCEKLIVQFEEVEDVRFQRFCEIWKDMRFSLVFTCRQTILELLEFCEEALHISKQFLLLPQRFKERIAGLYLLYGVYYKMPTDQFKIRITLQDWKNIMELHIQIKEGEHLDANYILSKLIMDNAFNYCIFDREFGLEKYFRMKERQCLNPYSILPAIKDISEEGQILTTINKLSEMYKQKKCLLSNVKGNPSLNLYNANISKEIMNDIRALETERRKWQTNQNVSNQIKKFETTNTKGNGTKIVQQKHTNKVRVKLGHGFDTDSSETDDDLVPEAENCSQNLPENFD